MDIKETLEPGYLSRRKQVDERVWEQILNSERGQSTAETPPQQTEPANQSEAGQTISNEKVHLDLLSAGWSKEQIDKEMGGLQVSAYDLIDLAVDIATGGITGAGLEGVKLLLKGAIKEGSKAIGKSAATDAAYGALSGGFMGLADYAGAGPVIQTLTGVIGPVATGGLLTLSRTSLAAFLKSLKANNPKVYKQVAEAIEQNPRNPLSQAVKSAETDISANIQDTYQKVKDLADNWDSIVTHQRRGTRPRELALAESAGIRMTPDDIKAIAPGTIMNDAQAAALIQTIEEVGIDVQKAAVKASQTKDPALMDETITKFMMLGEVDPKRLGVTAEAGRTLAVHNDPIKGGSEYLNQFWKLLEEAGTMSKEEFIDKLAALKTPGQVASFARAAYKPGFKDMIMEYWVNALLSNPATHAANFIGNTITTFYALPERAIAARLHFGTKPGVIKGESTQMVYGLVNGFMDALRVAGKALKEGEPVSGLTKVENYHVKAISADTLGLNEAGVVGRAVDLLGETVRLPGRFLMAADEFGKVVNYRMEVQAQAFRRATQEGLEGDELAKRIAELVENPTSSINDTARKFADYQTFTNELGKTGKAIQEWANSHPLAKMIFPFVKTPINIMKYSFERTPGLDLLSRNFRADLAAGGARRDLATAKMSLGAMTLATIGTLASAGYITGEGPKDRNLLREKRATGWQPNSVKIGDQYFAFNRLDPLGALFGVAANFVEMAGEMNEYDAEKLGVAAVLAFSDAIISKNYLTGLSNVIDAVKERNSKAGNILQKQLGSFVPSGVAQLSRVLDPRLKEINGIMDELRSRIPGLSQDLKPRRNLKGDPVILGGGLGPDMISPIYTSQGKSDPVSDEIVRNKVSLSMPSKYVSGYKPPTDPLAEERAITGVKLTPKQYDSYVALAGNELKTAGKGMWDALTELVQSPVYQRQSDGPDGGKALLIRSTVLKYRQAALAQLREEFPDLDKKIRDKQREKIQALMPAR